MNTQEELENKIKVFQDAYYAGEALVTDSSFDALWDELAEKFPESELLQEVGADSSDGWPKKTHLMTMGSQDKFNTPEALSEWIRKEKIQNPIIVQPKFDGLSLELQYAFGNLVAAVTRGDGRVGDDITPNAFKIPGIVLNLPNRNWSGSIRGEVLLPLSTFNERFSEKYSNARNTAVGFLKKSTGENCKYLVFKAYEAISIRDPLDRQSDVLEFLENMGFDEIFCKICLREESIVRIWKEVMADDSRDILWDGLVLKQNKIDHEDLRTVRPRTQRAFKFLMKPHETVLNGVTWQLSRGTLTPVAELEPINIDGTIVKRASLVNWNEIERLDIAIGDTVEISKRGEIIPKIERVIFRPDDREDIFITEECPACGSSMISSESASQIYCSNSDCSSREMSRIMRWVNTLDVKGFGMALVSDLYEGGVVTKISDLYTFDLDSFEKSYNRKANLRKAVTALRAVREVSLQKFIKGFDIPNFGERMTAKAMDAGIATWEALKTSSKSQLTGCKGIGESRAETFIHFREKLMDDMEATLKHIGIPVMEKTRGGLSGISFCFTGSLHEYTRKQIELLVTLNGGTISGVSKTLNYLVTNTPDSGSSKNKKAQDLGVEIITEDQFENLVSSLSGE